MNTYNTIGKRKQRIDGAGKVAGKARFFTDLEILGSLYAAPIYATVPFGRVISIDLSAAQRMSGFIDYVDARDVPGENQVGVIIPDQPLFAAEIVRYVGDTIGLVVANDPATALRMARAVKVDYESYEPAFTIEDSKTMSGRQLHESNLACEHKVVNGDVSRGMAEADLIVEGQFETPAQEHYYLEPQGCAALPEADHRMSLLGSLQCPFYVQKAVAKALGIPFSHISVEQAPTGGAFGGKEDVPSELCARVAVAANKVQKPVTMIYDRRDDIQLTSKRHPFKMQYRVGVSAEGKLIAADVELEENSGAYASLSSVVSYRASVQAMGPYVVPNVRIKSSSFYTNLPPNGAFRGFGSPQAAFGHERIMDIIAARLGMDPVVLRRKNLLRQDSRTVTGQKLSHSVGALETLDRACAASDWDARRDASEPSSRFLTGLGVATSHYGNCLGAAGWSMDGAGVNISIARDGSVAVAFGLVEMGQGALTAVAQMTAEALGIGLERITVLPTRSDQVPDSGPAVASRNIVMTGQAIRNAGDRLRPILKRAAAKLFDCAEEDICISADQIKNTKTEESAGFGDLADFLYLNNYQMTMTGWWHVPDLEFDPATGNGSAYFTYSYATQVAQVRVDKFTGIVHVDKFWAAHDVGQAINPAGIEGQVEGGITQGIGWALTEDLHFTKGRVVNENLSTYLLPTAADSAEVETIIVQCPEPNGPWGAKGIGEPAIIPTAAAIANAVSNALGHPVNELPITPARVLELCTSAVPV